MPNSPLRQALVGVVLVLVASTFACSEVPTDPLAPSSSVVDPPPTRTVRVVERNAPLPQDLSVSRRVGPLGGVLTLPQAGLSVTVPPGALLWSTEITITAPAGALVGYRFEPHGQTFLLPLVVHQDLRDTDASALGSELVAAYHEGRLAPIVEALELLPLDLVGGIGVFAVTHFSGYVIGTN